MSQSVSKDCQTCFQQFVSKDLSHWTGLPDDCLLSDLTQTGSYFKKGMGLARLGRHKTNFKMLVVEGEERSVRVWLEEEKVLLLDVKYPQIVPDLPTLVARWGEPEAKLGSYLGTLFLSESEWVYPQRGATLFVNPKNKILLRLAVYPITTLETYQDRLRLNLRRRRLPPKRR